MMSKRKERDEQVPEFEKLPDGTVKIGGEMLARLRANNQSREGLAEVHKLTVTASYEAAEKCVQRLAAEMTEWWAKMIVATGLDPQAHYKADPHTGIISVVKDEEDGAGSAVLRELVRSLREGGIETVVKRVNAETGEEVWVSAEPEPPAKPN